jgi:hypothetical protein
MFALRNGGSGALADGAANTSSPHASPPLGWQAIVETRRESAALFFPKPI